MPKPLSVTKSIGPTAARELLFFFIRNAENGHDFLRNMTDGDVEAWAKLNGYPWQETIDELANDFFRIVPEFENIASSASSIIETTGGASAEVTFSVDGVPVETHKAELLDPDSRGRFVSTEAKLKKWMPILAPHFSIDLGKSRGWTTTLRLKKLRDDVAIHPKVGQEISSPAQIASAVNDFREVAALLFVLVKAFPPGYVDSPIIRAMLYPEVRE